jgi:hypothetical protein
VGTAWVEVGAAPGEGVAAALLSGCKKAGYTNINAHPAKVTARTTAAATSMVFFMGLAPYIIKTKYNDANIAWEKLFW